MMPPGTYYVGDLCYVIRDSYWTNLISTVLDQGKEDEGEMEAAVSDTSPNPVRFACYFTKWGDGAYTDNERREYLVDSGSIGCVKISDLTIPPQVDQVEFFRGGHIIKFDEEFETENKGGFIRFGNVVIDTAQEQEQEEED